MPHALHSTTFKWNSKEAVLPVYKSLVEEKAKTPAETGGINSISLIAGAYGASSDEEDTDEASPEKAGNLIFYPLSREWSLFVMKVVQFQSCYLFFPQEKNGSYPSR